MITFTFTLQYNLCASSRLFQTTSRDMRLSMLEPKLITSILKYKSTDLLHYYKHQSQEKTPKTKRKVREKKKKKNPTPTFLPLSLLYFREIKQAGFKTRASDITKQKQIWKVSKPHKPHSHYYCVDSVWLCKPCFQWAKLSLTLTKAGISQMLLALPALGNKRLKFLIWSVKLS